MGRPQGSADKQKRKTRTIWTKPQLELLQNNFSTTSYNELQRMLNKCRGTIRSKAKELGLLKIVHQYNCDHLQKLHGYSGVYGIRNRTEDIYYVGSSVNIGHRLYTHILKLKAGSHYNQRLQADWSAGQHVFDVVVFTYATEAQLIALENEYIRTVPHTYNTWVPHEKFPPKKRLEQLWEKIQKGGPDECWEWLGRSSKGGYGRFVYDKKEFRVHRCIYYQHYGQSPEGYVVRHMCDNPRCCNPAHLDIGSYRDNNIDRYAKLVPGESSKLYKYKDEVRELRIAGRTFRELGEVYDVSNTTVLIFMRQTWPELCGYIHGRRGGNPGVFYEYQNKLLSLNELAALPECIVTKHRLKTRLCTEMDVRLALTTPFVAQIAVSPQCRAARRKCSMQVTAFGETKSLMDWLEDERCNTSEDALRMRLAKGMVAEEAIETPSRVARKLSDNDYIEIRRSTLPNGELAQHFGVSPTTIRTIRKSGGLTS